MADVCMICGRPTDQHVLTEVNWLAPDVIARMANDNPNWKREDGACPACVQKALLTIMLEQGEDAMRESVQDVFPLDAEAAFGALPTPLRMHADPRFTGQGVTIAFIDSGFFPHPDLTQPTNRIKTWVDASTDAIKVKHYTADEFPTWDGWDDGYPSHWHGLMTSTTAAGNGWLSRGLYRGIADHAELVLIQVLDERGAITNESIARALRWLAEHGHDLGVRVVNMSLGGDPVEPLYGNPVDRGISVLVDQGMCVVVAAGNNGERRLVPPATAPSAITIGGIDDKNMFDPAMVELWHSNYGEGAYGIAKPELVAPSIWVVAPILPGSSVAADAERLFSDRQSLDPEREAQIAAYKLITPYYQHVDGTSFAAPIVSSVIACMLEANPDLLPNQVYDLLKQTAHPVNGASRERQGFGAVDAGRAVARALDARYQVALDAVKSPEIGDEKIVFRLHDHSAHTVQVVGTWNDWALPGRLASQVTQGVWEASIPRLASGQYAYKFVIDGQQAMRDPHNPLKAHDGYGAFNSLVIVPPLTR